MRIDARMKVLYTIVFVIVILSLILLFCNLMVYNRSDVIQAYEDQIRVVQDKSLVETIKSASFKEHTNEISGEKRTTISTGSDYYITCVYTDTGQLIDIHIVTYTPIFIAISTLLGTMFGMLLSLIICGGIESIMEGLTQCKR